MKRIIVIGIFLVAIVTIVITYRSNASKSYISPVSDKGTRIIDYVQTYTPKQSEEGGWCWTRSIAAPANQKAWRCQGPDNTGVVVYGYDPCFELSSTSVVCDVDPEKEDSGFVLNLKESVPSEQELEARESSYWRLRLATGALCTPHTGTMTMTNEKRFVLFSCDDGTGIYIDGIHDLGGALEAENITYGGEAKPGDGDLNVLKNERVLISTAWR